MKNKSTSKFIANSLLATSLISGAMTLAMTTSSVAYDHGYHGHYNHHNSHQVYHDNNFGQTAQRLRMDLRRQGYIVMDIQPEQYKGNSALKVYAKKGNQAYEMLYSYPSLKLLTSEKKAWSQLWHNQHQGQYYNHAKNSIYEDANFNDVLKKAENKLKGMGYSIDEIEADDYNNQPILKANVDLGDKEYDIRLSYPSLKIISIEED